jgi:antitoxin ChpS
MHTTNLRKVGGSVMVARPPALLDLADLHVGSPVAIQVKNGRLVIRARKRPRYTVAELLAASDYSQPPTEEDPAWIDAPPAGRKLL